MTKTNFKQVDAQRAIRAAKAEGLDISCIECNADGMVRVLIGEPISEQSQLDHKNDWSKTINGS